MAIGAKAIVRLKFKKQKQITPLLDALTPEANALITRRANIKLVKDGLYLVLTVEADDTVALRATLNAYLRWINCMVNVISVVEHN
jgi:tRNA threonylcarbamoyladenosine modification (KEOPS) complex  Pcc1 subunit